MGGRANPLRDAAAIVGTEFDRLTPFTLEATDEVAMARRGGGVTADDAVEPLPLDVQIDWDRCMGSGNCVFWAPETFDLSDDGHAVVVDAAATDEERLRTAAQGCPVGAISLWRAGAEVSLEENT